MAKEMFNYEVDSVKGKLDLLNFRITSGVCDVLNNPIYSASFCQFSRLLDIYFVLTTTANLVFLHSESSYNEYVAPN